MNKNIVHYFACILCFMLLNGFVLNAAAFTDVPEGHWAYNEVYTLAELGVTSGLGDGTFGMGQEITRAEFITFLCKIMNWTTITPETGSFDDNMNREAWYYEFIETGLQHGAIEKEENGFFRPNEPITREELAVMLVNAVGYGNLASALSYLPAPFSDVEENKAYITMAKDFGIVSGISDTEFMPSSTAAREQAAAMMVRMYNKLNQPIKDINGFYAIRSANQQGYMQYLDSVCFGWGRLEMDGDNQLKLNYTAANNNEYAIPDGYEEPYRLSRGKDRLLMIAVPEQYAGTILQDDALREKAVQLFADAVIYGAGEGNEIQFDGVVVDFETLKGETSRTGLNVFLMDLRNRIGDRKIYTAVHPSRREGIAYYDGYDYRMIGEISDKVILMAHDYNAKSLTEEEMERGVTLTPLSPLDEVYFALQAITDQRTGVQDRGKIMLQFSFDTAQWKVTDGKVVNSVPYNPDYETLIGRMGKGVAYHFNEAYQSPSITFYNEDDDTENIVWYEDTRSIQAKLKLARMFSIEGISIWRLGTIPDGGGEMNVAALLFNR